MRGRIKLAEEEVKALEDEEGQELERDVTDDEKEDDSDHRKYGLPRVISRINGDQIFTRKGTIPRNAYFACGSCGIQQAFVDSVKTTEHTAPLAVYALQCFCPHCAAEGYNYNGRYFKSPNIKDLKSLACAEEEWRSRNMQDLKDYWPKNPILFSHMTHVRQPLPQHGYTHWWKMFNSRQLLVHSQILKIIIESKDNQWSLELKEQALGCFQQYLRNQNMFCLWNTQADKLEPLFSNNNYSPKQMPIENNFFAKFGRGNWRASSEKLKKGLEWINDPWELIVAGQTNKSKKSDKGFTKDSFKPMPINNISCGSSTDLSILGEQLFDLVITDPPFGNNLYYADLADFFYVWLRIALHKWYNGQVEDTYFEPDRTPHVMEAIDNPVEHPDNRNEWEKSSWIAYQNLEVIRRLSGNEYLNEGDLNPLHLAEPASDFYRQTLTACWSESARLLKPGGIMAFTFHHSKDAPWVDVLKALFDAGFILVATYPVSSDEMKGKKGEFGSKKIEYDIMHVCRKMLEDPQPVAWANMRRWVKEETAHLKEILESSHGNDLSEADLRVILRGKALEFYSHHYGQIYTGKEQLLSVKDALLGINQLLDDLLESEKGRIRPPESAEPASRLFLRIFYGRSSMTRDDLHKTLRGTGFSQSDFEDLGWMRVIGSTAHAISIVERFDYFTMPGRNRAILKRDLDKAHFLIGAAMPHSRIDVTEELNRETLQLKRSVDDILKWYSDTDLSEEVRAASKLASGLVGHWRARMASASKQVQTSLFDVLEEGGL